MKKILIFLVCLLFISNGIWCFVYVNELNENESNQVKLYTLSGSENLWDIKDYKILITPYKILRGHGELIYKGDPKELEKSEFFKSTFYELTTNNNKEPLFSNVYHSTGGPLVIDALGKDTGSSSRPYSNEEVLKDQSHYESTTLEITWKNIVRVRLLLKLLILPLIVRLF